MQQLQAMTLPHGHLRLLSLINRFEGGDAELAAALGVNRTTVWRLRSGKIFKINKYIMTLEDRLGEPRIDPITRIIEDLTTWSHHSADVRALLTSLHNVLHDSAT